MRRGCCPPLPMQDFASNFLSITSLADAAVMVVSATSSQKSLRRLSYFEVLLAARPPVANGRWPQKAEELES